MQVPSQNIPFSRTIFSSASVLAGRPTKPAAQTTDHSPRGSIQPPNQRPEHPTRGHLGALDFYGGLLGPQLPKGCMFIFFFPSKFFSDDRFTLDHSLVEEYRRQILFFRTNFIPTNNEICI